MEIDALAADPLWQKIALAVFAVIVLWNMLDGRRRGFWRKCSGLLSLAAAYLCAWAFNAPLAELIKTHITLPFVLLQALAALVICIVAYILCHLLIASLTRPNDEERPRTTMGALAGLSVGLIWAYLLFAVVRLTGMFAETLINTRDDPALVAKEQPVAAAFVKAKRSMELGKAALFVRAIDPLPHELSVLTEKTARLIGDELALLYLARSPAVQQLANDPRIKEIANDEEVQRLFEEGNYPALLRHPKIVAATDDKDLQQRVRDLNFEHEIDKAQAQADAARAQRQTQSLEGF